MDTTCTWILRRRLNIFGTTWRFEPFISARLTALLARASGCTGDQHARCDFACLVFVSEVSDVVVLSLRLSGWTHPELVFGKCSLLVVPR